MKYNYGKHFRPTKKNQEPIILILADILGEMDDAETFAKKVGKDNIIDKFLESTMVEFNKYVQNQSDMLIKTK